MNTTKDITFKMESKDNSVSPESAGNAILTMAEVAQSFQEECAENKKFVQKVRPPKEGSFVLIFEFVVNAEGEPQSFLKEHPLITRYMRILKEFFEWKLKLGGALPEIKGDALVFEEAEHRLDPISIQLLDPSSATSQYAARTFRRIEAEDTIKEVCLYSGDSAKPYIRIPKLSYPSFAIEQIPVLETEIRLVVKTMLLTVESPVLTGRNIQWKFYYDGREMAANIADDVFLDRVKRSSEQFSNGDKLEAEVEILQDYNPRLEMWTNKKYTIKRVIRHIPYKKQQGPRFFD